MDPPRVDSLAAIEDALWRELVRAPHDPQHPWRTPVLATTDGEVGDARTVALRAVDRASGLLVLYTDARAAKVAQIARHPLGTLVLWSPELSWQLRIRAQLSAATEGLAVSSAWARLSTTPAARDYLSSLAPGSALDTATGERGERAHFALIEAQVQSIDWLELHATRGHRRARFDTDATPRWLQA
jgi:pyridoxine/pyridoxamine 5'-phosphate oxidase